MPAEFSVSDADIEYAEGVLLRDGESFDEERRIFIRNLGTLDLQAVPGSGKTTALLAKLLILDRYLPFKDGSGILVISHTNAAIDEIKGRIGSHCTSLFRYPNFIGTIQSFVDQFLAVPFYADKYKKLPLRIDDDIYNQRFSKPPFKIKDFTQQENSNARRYLMATPKTLRWSLIGGKTLLTDGYCGTLIDFKKPKGNTKPENYTDWSPEEKNRVRLWISKFKVQILNAGCLCYDDAYLFASASLLRNPPLRQLLQKRFSHVFVDEMQDMEKHQHDLLEDVFFDGGRSVAAFQRIGDKNQSIFDGKDARGLAFWIDRGTVLELNGSYRLSPALAAIVSCFAVSPLKIEGRGRNDDGTDISIKPHLIVYSDSTQDQVISRYAAVVQTLLDNGTIPASLHNKYKAIAWATQKGAGKVRLCDYYPNFSREEQQQRPDHQNLESYISNYDKSDQTLSSVERSIGNALLRILREEGIVDMDGALYSKVRMREFLKESKPDYWTVHQAKIYEWCMSVVRGDGPAALLDIRNCLPMFLLQFGKQISASANFVNGMGDAAVPAVPAVPAVLRVAASKKAANVLLCGSFEVEVSTVHRVKGETHTATLYMETFYERGAGGNYESERLSSSLSGNAVAANAHNLIKQSAKMVYVGFSRPTHLLCFAVHERRFTKFEADLVGEKWAIIRV